MAEGAVTYATVTQPKTPGSKAEEQQACVCLPATPLLSPTANTFQQQQHHLLLHPTPPLFVPMPYNMPNYWLPNQPANVNSGYQHLTVIERCVVYKSGNYLVRDFERLSYYSASHYESYSYAPN